MRISEAPQPLTTKEADPKHRTNRNISLAGNKSFYKENVVSLYKNTLRAGPLTNNDFHHYANKGGPNVNPSDLTLAAKKQRELNIHVRNRYENQRPVLVTDTLKQNKLAYSPKRERGTTSQDELPENGRWLNNADNLREILARKPDVV